MARLQNVMMTELTRIRVVRKDDVVRITLARPAARNAFDAPMLDELSAAIEEASRDAACRALCLEADGPVFCAGADLTWMRTSGAATPEVNRREALRLGNLFLALSRVPCPSVAIVQGAALGGGAGLAAAVDIVIAAEGTRFGFTEVRLGIVPAVISPFAIRKIGAAHALRWFQSGEVFDAVCAARMGLVSEVVLSSELEARRDALLLALRAAAPGAQRRAKRLALAGCTAVDEVCIARLAEEIAQVRSLPEAQEGLLAFLEKRPAAWSPAP
ncbi:MAG: enoyl-CoA hydratase/isomerase family protein [Planctomycetes bacterium]|nr:enoyl-CoA hydratase/isomerase family protein [Planctomycetota bacterium]